MRRNLLIFSLFLALCTTGCAPRQPVQHGLLQVVNTTCEPFGNTFTATVTVRNVGQTQLQRVHAFMAFTDSAGATISVDKTYLDPTTLAPGGLAQAKFYSPADVSVDRCVPQGFQGPDGSQIPTQ